VTFPKKEKNRMVLRKTRRGTALTPLFCVALIVGCGDPGVPESMMLQLPDGSTVEADLGSGAATLANSTWQFVNATDTGSETLALTLSFGDDGELLGVADSPLLQPLFGDAIQLDGKRHATRQAGVQNAAGAYTTESEDGEEVAIGGLAIAYVAGIEGGKANVLAFATFDEGGTDILRGHVAFSTRVTLLEIEGADVNESLNFIGFRVGSAE
jgi:hypothetical protein